MGETEEIKKRLEKLEKWAWGEKPSEERPIRIKIKPHSIEKIEKQSLIVEVESEDDLERLATHLDTCIMGCDFGQVVIDVKNKILFKYSPKAI